MSIRAYGLLAGAVALLVWASPDPAQALSEHECSQKYRAAEAAGTLNGMKWNEFRRAECSADASATAAPTAEGSADSGTEDSNADSGLASWLRNLIPSQPSGNESGTGSAPTGNYANAVFPTSVSPQYANESVGRARELTCLDQYRANKANGGNGGLEWIERGGGYYSECNKRLGGN